MARRITSDTSILGGMPVIEGTRIPVYLVLDYLSDRYNVGDILADFPYLTAEDISAALEYASQLAREPSALRETEKITMVDARRELTRLPERLETHPATMAVTRRGKPVLAIMTWEDYEAILETLEVLSDEEAMEQLRRSIREVREDKAVSWEESRARLGA